ncbi:MAG: tellurium resistance protein TerC [Deltaproteobacteria bacterium RBG_13_52_11]|nr:MAG: tellurium resistance protein TerC [Deltaproteobacteria bacterium RBG_13_52_11]
MTWDLKFFTSILSIILIDLVLAGDNAVVIAMAVRRLPRDQRLKGIAFGAGAAVVLRVILTFFVAQLLQITFIKLAGGAVILWLAVKLFIGGEGEGGAEKEASSMFQAIRFIVIADITMSTDNVLAVAGASHGNPFLLIFGLIVSIPFVVFTSNLLSILMDKYPIIILIGAAVLGRVGGEMMITDPFIGKFIHPNKIVEYAVQIVFAVGVIVVGKLWMQWRSSTEEAKSSHQTQ